MSAGRRRHLADPYYSPARYELVKESLKHEADALRSTASKSNYSWVPPSSYNKVKLVENHKDSIMDNKILEEKRINLSLRFDFCLMELFHMMDKDKNGYLTLAEIDRFALANYLGLDTEDCAIIIDRFDKDRDGRLSFAEFCAIFSPDTLEYRKSMQDRLERNIFAFVEYTLQTQQIIKDLLKAIVTVEENFENTKARISEGHV